MTNQVVFPRGNPGAGLINVFWQTFTRGKLLACLPTTVKGDLLGDGKLPDKSYDPDSNLN